MKKIAQLMGLGLFALALSSCGFGGCCAGGKTVRVGCENRPNNEPCGICGSIYDPSPGCCDVVSVAVLKRATTQGG
ncbi:hypothetical protein N9230_05720, partial [Akkermansiaceae bacterium]|nr:hypothetical protein [Akkermansiaceae bacterium]